jgi:exodeoxyribonuclease X
VTTYLVDTETTGKDDPEPIELAFVELTSVRPLAAGAAFTMRYTPSKPITLGAMATHGITMDDLRGAPPSSAAKLPDDATVIVGHNVDFDWLALGKPDVLRIDTCAMARKVWPYFDSHSLWACLFSIDPLYARAHCRSAHGAAADVAATLLLLDAILSRVEPCSTWEEVHAVSERARVPETMPFGKHKGVPLTAVPRDYVRWLLGQGDVDPYLRQALEARR